MQRLQCHTTQFFDQDKEGYTENDVKKRLSYNNAKAATAAPTAPIFEPNSIWAPPPDAWVAELEVDAVVDDEDPECELAIEIWKAESICAVLATISSRPLYNDAAISPREIGELMKMRTKGNLTTHSELPVLIQYKTLAGHWPRDAASSPRYKDVWKELAMIGPKHCDPEGVKNSLTSSRSRSTNWSPWGRTQGCCLGARDSTTCSNRRVWRSHYTGGRADWCCGSSRGRTWCGWRQLHVNRVTELHSYVECFCGSLMSISPVDCMFWIGISHSVDQMESISCLYNKKFR